MKNLDLASVNPETTLLKNDRATIDQRHEFSILTGEAQFDDKPIEYRLYLPKEATSDVPILINDGYMAPPEVYTRLAEELAAAGAPTILHRPPRNVSLGRLVFGGHIRQPLKKLSQAAWQVMKTTQSEHGFEMFDIVGHSMGTPVSLSLAAEKPDSVRSVLCVGGAGFDEEHTLPEMIVRAGRLAKHEIAPRGLELLEGSQPVKVIAAMTGHALRHPVHTLAEGYYVTHVDARTDLQRVRAKGIFVGAIIFGDDSFFDAQKVRTRTEGILDYAEFIADGQHIRPQQLPYRAAMEILAGLAMLNSQIKQPNSRISLRVS